jgi:23S rRNA (cytosine1962-C5)-methyltransferase
MTYYNGLHRAVSYNRDMDILVQKGFPDYELIDSGEGMRLERYGTYTIARPDPQALWDKHADEAEWQKADAVFDVNQSGSKWQLKREFPEFWPLQYNNLKFNAGLTPFKHTGIFLSNRLCGIGQVTLLKKQELSPKC